MQILRGMVQGIVILIYPLTIFYVVLLTTFVVLLETGILPDLNTLLPPVNIPLWFWLLLLYFLVVLVGGILLGWVGQIRYSSRTLYRLSENRGIEWTDFFVLVFAAGVLFVVFRFFRDLMIVYQFIGGPIAVAALVNLLRPLLLSRRPLVHVVAPGENNLGDVARNYRIRVEDLVEMNPGFRQINDQHPEQVELVVGDEIRLPSD